MTQDKLTIDDIVDLRAYERERETIRDRIIALKRDRRVSIGPVVTLVFENRDTVQFQIHEMARAERLITDEAIQAELDAYNPLIPEPNHLSATVFIELTSKEEMERWLPALVGIERAIEFRLGLLEGSDDAAVVRCTPEAAHAQQLTRPDTTASVHYVTFAFTDEQIAAFVDGPVTLAVAHPAYEEATILNEATKASLADDLRA
ncbi:MAG: DUF3501 family protein [Actinobacteria bacterium]|nr:DUF3501 family protein [Actinomycetota bacterium]